MKFHSKIIKLKILGIFLIILFFINISFNFFPKQFFQNKPKISGIYYDIEINDLPSSSNDWGWASTQPWFQGGSGTPGDPYRIQWFHTFTYSSGSGNCMLIEHSTKHFKIQGCTFNFSNSGYAGLRLNNVSNAEITDNRFHNNSDGIYLYNCSNNIIRYNNIFENEDNGIEIYGSPSFLSKKNRIEGNTITKNKDSGISIQNSDHNIITGWGVDKITENPKGIYLVNSEYNRILGYKIEQNVNGIDFYNSPHNYIIYSQIRNNSLNGVLLEYNCHNNSFLENTINDNNIGLNVDQSNDIFVSGNGINNNIVGIDSWQCDNINITGNVFKRNKNSGISLGSSKNSTIMDNIVNYNDYGGIRLGGCFNCTILNNTANSNQYGIDIQNCNKTRVLDNKVKNNEYDGIYLYKCNNTRIVGNIANNNSEGINVDRNCNYLNITENIFKNNRYRGIFTYELFNSTISNNTFYNNSYSGISLDWSLDNILYDNKMLYCGLEVYGPRKWMLSNEIDVSNTVNGKPLYFFKKENGLSKDNFSNAGQIILVNCNNSKITNVNVSYGSRGILMYQCENNTLSNFNASHNRMEGVKLRYGNDNKITGIIASHNLRYGIHLEYSTNNNISSNIVNYNEMVGILLDYGCNYNNISKNNLSYNGLAGISIDNCHYVNVTENLMINSGLRIEGSSWDLTTYSSNAIDTSNEVNGKPLYYYVSKNNLGSSDFINAGQIILIRCNDSLISGLTISHSTSGVYLFDCENNQIMNNNFSNNTYSGLYIENCYNITVIGNIIKNNGFYGIHMRESDNNKIINCTIIDEFLIGYQVVYMDWDCDDNIIINCTMIKFGDNGIYLGWGNEDNIIYYNNIIGGGRDEGTNNIWDDGYAGNYWADYTGVDLDQDGIGDSNYSISGSAKANDTRPLMYPIDIDTDGDGFTNYEEYTLGVDNYRTNVINPDSDYDGLSDYGEWLNSTDPWNNDSDSDGMPDGWEVFNQLDPLSISDKFSDIDNDFLLNLYEYLNSTDPNNNDTDGDSFLDGIEVGDLYPWRTDPLNEFWYPMPNLAVLDFKVNATETGKRFFFNITITNNGIWRAENVVIIIVLEGFDLTLYNNSDNPIDLEVDEQYQDLIQSPEISIVGDLVVQLKLDPENLINEAYSLKNGSFRINSEGDNKEEIILTIKGGPPSGLDPVWIVLISVGIVAFAGVTGSIILIRPRMKRRASIKRQVGSAKIDIENFETNFRSYIKMQLKDAYESIWWEEGIPEYIRKSIESKISYKRPKKLALTIDRMEFLDLVHLNSIITESKNWDQIFSETFPDKNIIVENIDKLRVFKKNLYEGNVTSEDFAHYPLYINAIMTYFIRGLNVFLSYSTIDADHFKISEIVKRLQAYPKIDKVFYWQADSGESIVTYMERTLRLSKVFVFFCSENSIKSKAVEDEWQAAFQMRKKGLMKLVPVYEEEELIPFLLTPLLNVKFTRDDFDGFIQKLYEEILR